MLEQKEEVNEYAGLPGHNGKTMIEKDFWQQAKRGGAELDGRLYYWISTAFHLIIVMSHMDDLLCSTRF